MAALSENIGLLFRIRADGDQAAKEMRKIKGDVKDLGSTSSSTAAGGLASLTKGATGLSSVMAGPMAAAAAVAATVITTIATAAAAAATQLFHLTVSASEYGSAIFDAQSKTGLSALTLSTLKVAADNAGSSLEQVVGASEKFAKTIGAAQDGSKEAQKTLKDLGITSLDLETAMSQAFETIAKMPEGIDQIVASQKLYGKSGADLIPVIKQLGDLEAAKQEAIRNGTALTEKDIKASDDLGDALGLLSAQAKAAAVVFTSDLMPVLTSWFTQSSAWYARNQGEVRSWGSTVASVVSGLGSIFADVFSWIRRNAQYLHVALFAILGPLYQIGYMAGEIIARIGFARGEANKNATAGRPLEGGGQGLIEGGRMPRIRVGGGGSKGGGGGGGAAQQAAKADAQAAIQIEQDKLNKIQELYRKTVEKLRKEFAETGDSLKFTNDLNAAAAELEKTANEIIPVLNRLEDQAGSGDTKKQIELRKLRQSDRTGDIEKAVSDAAERNGEIIIAFDKKTAEARKKILEQLAKDDKEIAQKRLEEWRKRETDRYEEEIKNNENSQNLRSDLGQFLRQQAEFDLAAELQNQEEEKALRKKEIEDTIKDEDGKRKALESLDGIYKLRALAAEEEFQRRKKGIATEIPEDAVLVKGKISALEAFIIGIGRYLEGVTSVVDANKGLQFSFEQLFTTIAGMGLQALTQLAAGFGQMVAAWVLGSDKAGGGFRKMIAQILANVASVAATYAILCLAAAALATTLWGAALLGGTPTQFLQAAAIFGAVAVGAAIAGRAVAGDAFKSQTGQVTGTNSGFSATGGQGSLGRGGEAYSSQGDEVQVRESGINSPAKAGLTLNVEINDKLATSAFGQLLKVNWESNGWFRQSMREEFGK